MTKTQASLAALSVILAACSAAASPVSTSAVTATAIQSSAAPAAVAEATPAAPARPRTPVTESAATSRATLNDAVSCDVRARPTSNGVLIQAMAHAAYAIDGDYDLVITKSGGGGSSDITQSGPFSAAAGETVTLGSAELGRDGRYRAMLVLRAASGEVCRRELRS
jgi:hypothetical protein